MKYARINNNGICDIVYESTNPILGYDIVEISGDVNLYIGKLYKYGAWCDSISLSYADGIITASYTDVTGTLQTNFNGSIIFDFEGTQETVQAINGIATIAFTIVDSGTYIVKTVNTDVNNGEVTING